MADATNFTGLPTVAIPVTDQDRTRALLEDLGFETRYGGELQEGSAGSSWRRPTEAVGELLDWDTAPLMFSSCDPDGNRSTSPSRREGTCERQPGSALDWGQGGAAAIEMPAWRHGSVGRPGG